MASLAHWQAVEFLSLQLEEWEDGFAVYQPAAGRTCFLNSLGMQILADLHHAAGQGMTESALSKALATRLEVHVDAAFRERIHTLLCRFDELGLIRQAPEGLNDAC
jgi:PqqD family protein of HPr-rel-A system